MYHFAAIPPTPEGEKMARRLFDQAWPRYPSVLDRIRSGVSRLTPTAKQQLNSVAAVLRPDKPVHIELLVYVGGLEDNVFTVAYGGQITTAVPIESPPDTREMLMTHEFTHAVQIGIGSFSGSFERTVGTIALTEGLASRVTQKLFPNRPETDSIEFMHGWLKQAEQHRVEILRGIRPFLGSDKPEDIERFTVGPGPVGPAPLSRCALQSWRWSRQREEAASSLVRSPKAGVIACQAISRTAAVSSKDLQNENLICTTPT